MNKIFSKKPLFIVSLIMNCILLVGILFSIIYSHQAIGVEKAFQAAEKAAEKDCNEAATKYSELQCDNMALFKIEHPDPLARDNKSSWIFSFSAGDASNVLWTSMIGVDGSGMTHSEGESVSTPQP